MKYMMVAPSFSTKYKKGEIALKILTLVVVGGAIMTVAILPGLPQIMRMFGAKTYRDRYRIAQSFSRLERQGYIRKRNKNDDSYVLTREGRKHIQETMLEKQCIKKLPRWDGWWRVLMFDIPEELASVRREVSVLIREMGMAKVQNSVFASPYPCSKEITKLARHYEIGEYFVYLETEKISCETKLKKIFHLK